MNEMNIEWASANEIAKHPIDIAAYGEQPEPVVRLAAVDEVIAEAVLFASAAKSDIVTVGTVKQAEAFLNSEIVAQWRKRPEDKS